MALKLPPIVVFHVASSAGIESRKPFRHHYAQISDPLALEFYQNDHPLSAAPSVNPGVGNLFNKRPILLHLPA